MRTNERFLEPPYRLKNDFFWPPRYAMEVPDEEVEDYITKHKKVVISGR